MDAEWVVWLSMHKFQALLLDEAVNMNTQLTVQVQKVADKLQLLLESMKAARGDENMEKLLRAVYFIEDATDRFLARTVKRGKRRSNSTSKSLRFIWSQFLYGFEMKKFMAQIRAFGPSNTVIGSVSHGETALRRGRGISFSSYFVGLDDRVKQLVAGLVPDPGSESSNFGTTQMISVVGERGSGKTALVKAAFENVSVKRHFRKCLWVNVCSYGFRSRELVFEMLKQVDEVLAVAKEPVLEQDLVSRLGKALSEERYLAVVDDVGENEVWERLRKVFPRSDNGSRIVVTTCNMDFASSISFDSTIKTGRLNDEDSWELFLKKVCMAEGRLNSFPELNMFKERIVMVCGGLPLAISLMGGLLSMKEADHSEWSRMINTASNVEDIFDLCYKELPACVKPCFLYMGLFPRASKIPLRRLLQLWMAEGLVAPACSGDLLPEDVADMCLEELINRNVIEVSGWRSDGIPKACHMPGALYDIFSRKAADTGLFYIHIKSRYASGDRPPFEAIRRLASYSSTENYPRFGSYIAHLRSFVSFNPRRGVPAGEISMFLGRIIARRDFGLLAVLDLEGVYKPRLPKTLGRLLNLRYLGLRSTALDAVPESVCELQSLQTLDVKHNMITTLPNSIWMMKNLRHLYMDWIDFDDLQDSSNPEPFAELQTLWGLSISQQSPILDTLFRITSLRKLGLRFSSTSQEPINNWIAQLTNLQSLRLRSVKKTGERGSIKLTTLADHQKLLDLYLLGVLPRPIDIKRLPPNLKILTLSMSQLRKDPMSMLGKLPHLNVLRLLAGSYSGEEMACHGGGFPHLHNLKLWGLLELKELTVEEGAMPSLRELEIRGCRRLNRLDGLRHVTTLTELILTNMPPHFGKEAEANVGSDVFIRENEWKTFPLLG